MEADPTAESTPFGHNSLAGSEKETRDPEEASGRIGPSAFGIDSAD